MITASRPEIPKLAPATSAFVLSAAITVIFNTALACAKDVSPALNGFMKSITGHHWITHSLADLLLFAGLAIVFLQTGVAQRIKPQRLTASLVGAVAVGVAGLALWYVLV